DGYLKAAEMTYLVDTGAYTDIGPRLAKAIAVSCTGPYNIENVWCDSLCVYTNHPYSTSFRGFGHASFTFCIERALDKLALELEMDPLELRMRNAIIPGNTTPTQVKATSSNTGNLASCLERLKSSIKWNEGTRIDLGNGIVRAKGISSFWKTSNLPTNSISGVFLNFNADGSINLNSGVVEYGPGMKTTLAQILAEKMSMNINRIHVKMEVDTQVTPEHLKTVASMTTYMAGRATLRAAEDLIRQLKSLAAVVLRCLPEDLDVAEEKVSLKQDPSTFVEFKDLVHGFKYPDGESIEGQILARGSFILNHLTELDRNTGAGHPGPAWAVGAQAVEVELDMREFTYRLINAVTVIDAGKLLNPKTARGLITGGMCMGLGLGSREAFSYDTSGEVLNTSLRTYKVIHIGEEPKYIVDFIETPQIDAPYGARGIAEHGIIGMPAALANALSTAAQIDLDQLPVTPETIWKAKTGGKQ
ncbi:MAG: molybdopterin cofactor-binding domain-containing protein, partial [Bacillota bacterium]